MQFWFQYYIDSLISNVEPHFPVTSGSVRKQFRTLKSLGILPKMSYSYLFKYIIIGDTGKGARRTVDQTFVGEPVPVCN